MQMARLAGYDATLVDPREAFGAAARFPGETIVIDWPDEALDALGLDARTCVVTLTHDPKIDDPAIGRALRSDVFYLGCLGSKRTHAKRVERLTAAGFTETEIAKIHAPVGTRHRCQEPGRDCRGGPGASDAAAPRGMKFGPLPLAEAEGAILAHSHAVPGGRLRKGAPLTAADIARLEAAGEAEVVVARLEPSDLGEDAAAARIGAALVPDPAGQGLRLTAPVTGRVNLFATGPGVHRDRRRPGRAAERGRSDDHAGDAAATGTGRPADHGRHHQDHRLRRGADLGRGRRDGRRRAVAARRRCIPLRR